MKRKYTVALLLLLAALALWIAWGNTALELNTYVISSSHLPEAFSGFRIAHVSDLHNAQMGQNNQALLNMLEEAAPDIIVITGDLVDSRKTDISVAAAFAKAAVSIAPCYYVTGNHEARLADAQYTQLEAALMDAGVAVLHDSAVTLVREDASISLLGMDDPSFGGDSGILSSFPGTTGETTFPPQANRFRILLSHRPELFEEYVREGFDLVFSGHAHGGQFRIPFIGGIIAPNQGLFPKYDAGLYTQGTTNMLVSRGIGNSLFPFRINNRPELLLVTLQAIPEETR